MFRWLFGGRKAPILQAPVEKPTQGESVPKADTKAGQPVFVTIESVMERIRVAEGQADAAQGEVATYKKKLQEAEAVIKGLRAEYADLQTYYAQVDVTLQSAKEAIETVIKAMPNRGRLETGAAVDAYLEMVEREKPLIEEAKKRQSQEPPHA